MHKNENDDDDADADDHDRVRVPADADADDGQSVSAVHQRFSELNKCVSYSRAFINTWLSGVLKSRGPQQNSLPIESHGDAADESCLGQFCRKLLLNCSHEMKIYILYFLCENLFVFILIERHNCLASPFISLLMLLYFLFV